MGRAPGVDELVGQRDGEDLLAESGADGGGGDGAHDGVILQGHRQTVTRQLTQHGLLVERHERGAVHHGHIDMVGGELLGRPQCTHGHQAAGHEYDVPAASYHLGLAELEGVVVLVEHERHLAPQQAQVGGTFVGGELGDGLLDVEGVARVDDGEVGHATEDRDVLGGLVAGPVTGGQTGQAADDVDVEVRLGDVQADEVVRAAGREDRVRGGERKQARLGPAGGRAEEQLLGHAHLEEPAGVGPREDVHVGVLAQVGGEADDPRVALGQFDHGPAEGGGRGAPAGVGEGAITAEVVRRLGRAAVVPVSAGAVDAAAVAVVVVVMLRLPFRWWPWCRARSSTAGGGSPIRPTRCA